MPSNVSTRKKGHVTFVAQQLRAHTNNVLAVFKSLFRKKSRIRLMT